MNEGETAEALQQRIATLEAELTRLRPIEAAAREVYAFLIGRRPGFAPTYAREILLDALEPNTARPRSRRPKAARPAKRRKQA